MPFERMVLLAFAWPLILPAAGWTLQLVLGWRSSRPPAGSWGAALGLGAGFVASYLTLMPRPAFPPVEATQWLPYAAIAASVLGLLEGLVRLPSVMRWLLRAVLAGVLVAVMVLPIREGRSWGLPMACVCILGLTAGALLLWWNLEAVATRITGAAVPLSLAVFTVGLGIVCVSSFWAMGGLLAISLAVGCFALAVAGLAAREPSMARGGIGVAAILLLGIGLDSYFYSNLTLTSATLLALTPLTLWVGWLPPLRRLRRWQAALICALAILVPTGVTAGLALKGYLAESASSEEAY
jgi:hypothetical protein